jgi:hypothetical protein
VNGNLKLIIMSKQYNWRAGMKVVCVEDRFPLQATEWGDQFPKRDAVYTVQEVVYWPGPTGEYGIALKLVELKNPGDRLAFAERRFRPLAESLTNASAAEEEAVMGITATLVPASATSPPDPCFPNDRWIFKVIVKSLHPV